MRGILITAPAAHTGIGAATREGATKNLDFLVDRLKVQQREAGVRHDLIDAVFALGGRGRSRPVAGAGEGAPGDSSAPPTEPTS